MAKMRSIKPVVRYLIPCDEILIAPGDARVSILGLVTNIVPAGDPPYPYEREMCVFVAITDFRGDGIGQVICIEEESGQRIFGSPSHELRLGADPLRVVGIPFRIRECRFPRPGIYSLQFWFDGQPIADQTLRLR